MPLGADDSNSGRAPEGGTSSIQEKKKKKRSAWRWGNARLPEESAQLIQARLPCESFRPWSGSGTIGRRIACCNPAMASSLPDELTCPPARSTAEQRSGPCSNSGGGNMQQMARSGGDRFQPRNPCLREAQIPPDSKPLQRRAASPPADLAELLRVAIDKALTAREMAQQGDRATNQRPHCSNRPTNLDDNRRGRFRNPLSFPEDEEEGSDTEGIDANDRFSEGIYVNCRIKS
uniref:Uncharacterized protein n=1 Tax=Sphaerodactylus townsendi TaxID=933632 RepID=A0ACB8G9S8_9SAUR